MNAQRRREEDGGQISWLSEDRRRHGHEEGVKDTTLREAFSEQVRGAKGPITGKQAQEARMRMTLAEAKDERAVLLEEARKGRPSG